MAAGSGRLAREIGQAGEIAFVEHEAPFILVVQHVLAEMRMQRGHARGDLGHPRLLGRAEQRAGTHKAQMVALQKPQLVGREAERVALAGKAHRSARTAPGSSAILLRCAASFGA